MSYRDSTDDGFEGEMLEGGQDPADFELVAEAERIFLRLTFLTTLAHLWKMAAVASTAAGRRRRRPPGGALRLAGPGHEQSRGGCWSCSPRSTATASRRPAARRKSLVEYDRRRGIKETLLEQIIAAAVETADAGRLIRVVMGGPPPAAEACTLGSSPSKRCSARCCAATRRPSAGSGSA